MIPHANPNGREKGEFKLPASEWAGFKAAVREAVNRQNAAMYEAAVSIHAALSVPPRKKGHALRDLAWDEMEKLNRGSWGSPGGRFSGSEVEEVVASVAAIVTSPGKPYTYRLRKPQKKDFPQHGNNVTAFSAGEATLVFDNGARTAVWDVPENNHAVEAARATVLGRTLFAALGKVKWTRGTGGSVYGNDEYNADAGRHHEGAGGSYTSESYGPGAGSRRGQTTEGLYMPRW